VRALRLARFASSLRVIGPLLAMACGSFENPSIVIDLRFVGIAAEPPEQVVPVDPENPLSTMFGDVQVCAIIADPGAARSLSWQMSVCRPVGGRRCDANERPTVMMGGGVIEDPELATTPQVACATVPGGATILPILQDAIENDSLSGFGGIDLNVMVRVVPQGGGEAQAIYGSKAVRYSPQYPEERVANANPTLTQLDVDRGEGTEPAAMPLGRCIDQAAPLALGPRETIHLMPVEPEGAREDYVVPTFEGGSRMFTENLRYEWLAGGGDWTRGRTGGPRDGAGNFPELDTEWESPAAEDLDGPTDIPLWVIQRDERGGARWFETCVRVTP
jgi:hypothetical protein